VRFGYGPHALPTLGEDGLLLRPTSHTALRFRRRATMTLLRSPTAVFPRAMCLYCVNVLRAAASARSR
jgi:hypothetical protein